VASAFGQVCQQSHDGASKVHEGTDEQHYRQTNEYGAATVEGSGL